MFYYKFIFFPYEVLFYKEMKCCFPLSTNLIERINFLYIFSIYFIYSLFISFFIYIRVSNEI